MRLPIEIVAKVQSATTGASSTLTYSFRTPDGAFYVLHRAASNADDRRARPKSSTISSDRPSSSGLCVRQPHIEQYAVADPVIGVVTSDADGAGTLSPSAHSTDPKQPRRSPTIQTSAN